MSTITLQEAQANLSAVIQRLSPGEELLITDNEKPVAKLTASVAEPPKKPRQLGTMRGSVLYMAPDFDAPLDDFAEHM